NCGRSDENLTPEQTVENLRAFAKLYGYVKYFHPSDEAAALDWDKFAVYGAAEVKKARNKKELLKVLEDLFYPIAPTIEIFPEEEKPEDYKPFSPDSVNGLKEVSWQHLGVGFGSANSIYKSLRLNKENRLFIGNINNFTTIAQGLNADTLQGNKIRLQASVKVDMQKWSDRAQLWLRVDRKNGARGFFDNMHNRPIIKKEWGIYTIEGTVAEDAEWIFFGCLVYGTGGVWLDDFRLFVEEDEKWVPVTLNNPGFELGPSGENPESWTVAAEGFQCQVSPETKAEGERSVFIQIKTTVVSDELFAHHPGAGEFIEKPLAGLSCIIPLVLYSDDQGTLGKRQGYSLDTLYKAWEAVNLNELTADDENIRLGDVIIAWNVFQHFYPYFEETETDWNSELTTALKEALEDKNAGDFYYTLCQMVAALEDGHGNVYYPGLDRAGLPFQVEWIDDQVVVTDTQEPENFKIGDIIVSVDGIPAKKIILDSEKYISGSPQWKRFRSQSMFAEGPNGSKSIFQIKRGDEILEKEVIRSYEQGRKLSEKPKIKKIEEGIFYVDLNTASMKEINDKIQELADAKGVVFDLRGYPNGNHMVINHLLTEKDTSAAWMKVPKIIYPDQENIPENWEMGWSLSPLEPRIKGKAVFLTDGRAISYAESFMSFIEHYKLAEIVGQPTAGTNGNVNSFVLPGSITVAWTGMKVVKHDGSQHHLIGIQPTIPMEKTIQGIKEGRDEFLEKAIEVIKQ
ncbi:MAG: peptidase S41, partial [Candidatus Aminicenantes bacterium]|nr:peptidase S41 [Candidatus Aminicenantes bacterium]